jgi:hypothetical protein
MAGVHAEDKNLALGITIALAAVLALASAAGATTFVGMNERALTRAADAVVLGTVEHIETVGQPDGGIDTLITLEVERTLKGSVGRLVTLKQPGGRLGDRVQWIAGSPRFAKGERQLVFVSAHRDGTARTTAFGMGQFVVVPHPRTGEPMAERRLDGSVLGDRPLRRAPLARLLRTVARAVAAAPDAASAPLITVPEELTTPGLERETVDAFTLMDSPSGRWFEVDDGQPIVYDVDADGDPALGATESFAAIDGAMAAWTNVSGASIVLTRGGTTAPAPLSCDGQSQIVFGDPFNEMPNPVGCSGVLALGGYCTSGQSQDVNGTRFYRISEGNITFNSGFGGCSFWNRTNLAEVATHELGHTIGIGHSSESDSAEPTLKDATMYYRAHFDGRGASVHADDLAAVRFVYPGPGGGDPNADDSDGDGWVDAQDSCPTVPNATQVDSDGDAMGDMCDPCPLLPGETADVCQPIFLSKLNVRMAGARSRLVWRGTLELPEGTPASAAAVLLVASVGKIIETAPGGAPRSAGSANSRRLRYKSEQTAINLRRLKSGAYNIRVTVRGVQLDQAPVPLISASLQLGATTFTDSLSCSQPRRRRLACRG